MSHMILNMKRKEIASPPGYYIRKKRILAATVGLRGPKPKSTWNSATLRGGEPKLFSSAGMEVKMLPVRNKTHNGLG